MASRLFDLIKNDNVQVEGSIRLGIRGRANPVRTQPSSAQAGDPNQPNQPQQVRIVESNSEYAIIEVMCACGNKCYVQCNYADMAKANA